MTVNVTFPFHLVANTRKMTFERKKDDIRDVWVPEMTFRVYIDSGLRPDCGLRFRFPHFYTNLVKHRNTGSVGLLIVKETCTKLRADCAVLPAEGFAHREDPIGGSPF